MQEVPPTEPVEEGDEGVWDTVGEPAGSRSPASTVEEILAQLERQPPAPQGSMEPVAAAVEEVVASGAQESTALAAAAVEEAVAAGAQEEVPAEGGLVDIASILGALAVTIVRSNL
jgi:predicted secreted protein